MREARRRHWSVCRVMARPAQVLPGMTRQDDARIQRCFRRTETVPGSEYPADTAMVVLWRPGPQVQEVKERLRVTGGSLQCG